MSEEDNSGLLINAARQGDVEKVRALIPVSDPKADDSMALFWAAHRGNIEMVKILLPVSEAWAYHNEALRIAYLKKHWAVVELLLPHCDPTDEESIRAPVALASVVRRPDIIEGL